MTNNKKIIIAILIVSILVGVFGISYALLKYWKTGDNQQLVTGDIYMNYRESAALTMSSVSSRATYDPNSYFEFYITGKNTNTLYDIWYEIILDRGDVPTGKIESNRIDDRFIMFRLVERVNNADQVIFTDKSYANLSGGRRVAVATIPKNTTSEITKTYRLYMWISDNVQVGNANNPDKDYEFSVWNNLFASVKVNVNGDFEEKDMATDASCFDRKLITIYTLNTNMSSSELSTCVTYIDSLDYEFDHGGDAEDYCLGQDSAYGSTFQGQLDAYYDNFDVNYLLAQNIISEEVGLTVSNYDYNTCGGEVTIPSRMNYVRLHYNSNIEPSDVAICADYLSNTLGWGQQSGETYESFCDGTGTNWGYTFQQEIDMDWFTAEQLTFLKNNNIIVEGALTSYPILALGYNNTTVFPNYSYPPEEYQSITLNNNLKLINYYAFANVYISPSMNGITIPASVRYIGRLGLSFNFSDYQPHNFEYNILGKPYISYIALKAFIDYESPNEDNFSTFRYGGTCQELHLNSSYDSWVNKNYIVNEGYNREYDVITTDSNTCKVYGNYDD